MYFRRACTSLVEVEVEGLEELAFGTERWTSHACIRGRRRAGDSGMCLACRGNGLPLLLWRRGTKGEEAVILVTDA